MNLNQVTLPAVELARSIAFYDAMGFTQIVDSPRYARFECPAGEATFSLHLVDTVTLPTAVVVYFECEDLDGRVSQLEALGFEFTKRLTDERWLWREARLQDPAGNVICLYWAGVNRTHPPWRMSA